MKRNINHSHTSCNSSKRSLSSVRNSSYRQKSPRVHTPPRVDPFDYSSYLRNYISTHKPCSHGKIHSFQANWPRVKEVSVQEVKPCSTFPRKQNVTLQEHEKRLPTIPENEILVILPTKRTISSMAIKSQSSLIAESSNKEHCNLIGEKYRDASEVPVKATEECADHTASLNRVEQCLQIGMIITNTLSLVCGIIVVSVAVWALADKRLMDKVVGNSLNIAVSILFSMGAVAVFISLLGLMGAIKEIKCILITYFIILLLIFAVMLTGGILIYIFDSQILESVTAKMLSSLKKYPNNQQVRDTWDTLQRTLQCCGARSASDWPAEHVPSSCCKKQAGYYISHHTD